MPGRGGQQGPQLLALMGGQLLGVPAQPGNMQRQAAGQRLAEALPDGGWLVTGDRGHRVPFRQVPARRRPAAAG
jgi:hypothetical protein